MEIAMISFVTRATSIAAAVAALSMLASAAAAQERPRDTTPPSKETLMFPSAQARAFGGVAAPNARLAGLFDAGGRPVRTKGVQSIQRIDPGVYCIRPLSNTNINVNTMIVVASVEYFYSELDEVQVQWASTQNGCGAGRIGIYTFQNPSLGGGNYVFSSNVGFSIIVP
jgi:hypothetical protein